MQQVPGGPSVSPSVAELDAYLRVPVRLRRCLDVGSRARLKGNGLPNLKTDLRVRVPLYCAGPVSPIFTSVTRAITEHHIA